MSVTATAADFTSTGQLSVQGSYETNPELARRNKSHVAEKQITPSWSGELDGETYGLDFDFSTSTVRTSDETVTPDSQRFDATVGGDLDLDVLRLSGSADYSRRAFNNTEFNDNELTTDADTATVSDNQTVDDATLTSRLEHDWSDRTTVFVEDTYRIVQFTGGNSTNFTNATVSTGARYEWSDVVTLTPVLEVRRFEPEDIAPTNVVEASMGINHQLSDTLVYNLTVGVLRAGRDQSTVFDASLEKTFEAYSIRLTGNRDVAPSDNGELRDSRSFGFAVSHDLSDLTRAGIDGVWRNNNELESRRIGFNMSHDISADLLLGFNLNVVQSITDNAAGSTTTMQYRADPFVNWAMAENVNARLSYRELWEDRENLGSANTRRVTLAVTYTHPFN